MVTFTQYQAEMVKFFLVLVGVTALGAALLAAGSDRMLEIIRRLKKEQ